jgi:hypothetical protein
MKLGLLALALVSPAFAQNFDNGPDLRGLSDAGQRYKLQEWEQQKAAAKAQADAQGKPAATQPATKPAAEALEDTEPARAAKIKAQAAPYDGSLIDLKPRAGVTFYMDWTRGKWSWTGMPVYAVENDRSYALTAENAGSFLGPIDSDKKALELVTFVPSYWHPAAAVIAKTKDGWTVKLDLVGANPKVKTTRTYAVTRDGRYKVIADTNPGADPTQGVQF